MARSVASGRRSIVPLLLGLSSTTFILTSGCDRSTSDADARVHQAVADALPQLSGSDQERSQASTALSQANNESAASLPARMLAKEALAQSELRTAEHLQPKIDAAQSEVSRLAWETEGLAGQIQASNLVAAALEKHEPSALQSALDKNLSDIKGADDKADWVKTDAGSVPALAAVSKDQAAIQARIAELQKTIQSLNEQRTAALAKSDELAQQSGKERGDKRVELFKQAADAHKQADDLVVQLDTNNEQLTRAQTDLAVRNGQAQVLNDAIASMGKQSADVTTTWQTYQKQIEAQRAQAKDLLGDEAKPAEADDSTGGPTVASKGLRLEEINKANRARREEAESHLNSAIGQFKEAATLAEQLQRDIQEKISDPKNTSKPEVSAWKDLIASLHPGRFQMQQANAEMKRAQLFAGRAVEANARQQVATMLKPILAAAKLTLPASYTESEEKVAADLKTSREQADASFSNADEMLGKVSEGTAENLRQSAHIAKLFADYSWYLLAAGQGDKDNALKHKQAAEAERDVVVQSGAIPRNLPAELAVAPTTAPTTAPGAAPGAPTETPATPPAAAPAPQG